MKVLHLLVFDTRLSIVYSGGLFYCSGIYIHVTVVCLWFLIYFGFGGALLFFSLCRPFVTVNSDIKPRWSHVLSECEFV